MTERSLYPLADIERARPLLFDLANVLRRHGYSRTTVLPRRGGWRHIFLEPGVYLRYLRGQPNNFRYALTTSLYLNHFAHRQPEAALLFRLFSHLAMVPFSELESILGGTLVTKCLDASLLVHSGGRITATLCATAWENAILFHDPHDVSESEKRDYVWLGGCSLHLAELVRNETTGRRFNRALDLCTGGGIQAINICGQCDEVTGTDINRRALAFASINQVCNAVENVRFQYSNLYESVQGDFDLILANPPFVLLEEDDYDRAGHGGSYGMAIALDLFQGLEKHLRPGGTAFFVASAAVVNGRDLLVAELRKIFESGGWAIDLFPLYYYYSRQAHVIYRELGVERCVLYIVRVVRTGDQLALCQHRLGIVSRTYYRARISLIRNLACLGLIK